MHPDGCRTAPPPMPASAPSPSPVRTRRRRHYRRGRPRRCGTCSFRSPGGPARLRPAPSSANRYDSTVEQFENRRAAYRAYMVGSDGHFEPLTWQLHRDHPPPARPPSSATATSRPAENRGARTLRRPRSTKRNLHQTRLAETRCAASAAISGWCGMAPA